MQGLKENLHSASTGVEGVGVTPVPEDLAQGPKVTTHHFPPDCELLGSRSCAMCFVIIPVRFLTPVTLTLENYHLIVLQNQPWVLTQTSLIILSCKGSQKVSSHLLLPSCGFKKEHFNAKILGSTQLID